MKSGSRMFTKWRCQLLAGAGPLSARLVAGALPAVGVSAIATPAEMSAIAAAAARSPLRYIEVSEVGADELSTEQGMHSCACCEHAMTQQGSVAGQGLSLTK